MKYNITFKQFLLETMNNNLNYSEYYFAYGSNMFLPQMKNRLKGNYQKLGLGVLKGYEFVYNKLGKDGSGKANIIKNSGNKVLGVLYRLPQESLNIMSKFEKGYSKEYVDVYFNNNKIKAITYLADKHKDNLLPTKNYKHTILTYAITAKLPKDYINFLSNF